MYCLVEVSRTSIRSDRKVLQENGLYFEFSLCLSRACLGKKIVFIYKWLLLGLQVPALLVHVRQRLVLGVRGHRSLPHVGS